MRREIEELESVIVTLRGFASKLPTGSQRTLVLAAILELGKALRILKLSERGESPKEGRFT